MSVPKTPLLAGVLAALPLTLAAQGWAPPPAPPETPSETAPDGNPEAGAEDGVDLIGRGAALLLDEFLRKAQPQIDDMSRNFSGAMETLGPLVGDLAAQVDDMRNYDKPERLTNGDIILRRKAGAPPPPPPGEMLRRFESPSPEPEVPPQPEIEL